MSRGFWIGKRIGHLANRHDRSVAAHLHQVPRVEISERNDRVVRSSFCAGSLFPVRFLFSIRSSFPIELRVPLLHLVFLGSEVEHLPAVFANGLYGLDDSAGPLRVAVGERFVEHEGHPAALLLRLEEGNADRKHELYLRPAR